MRNTASEQRVICNVFKLFQIIGTFPVIKNKQFRTVPFKSFHGILLTIQIILMLIAIQFLWMDKTYQDSIRILKLIVALRVLIVTFTGREKLAKSMNSLDKIWNKFRKYELQISYRLSILLISGT